MGVQAYPSFAVDLSCKRLVLNKSVIVLSKTETWVNQVDLTLYLASRLCSGDDKLRRKEPPSATHALYIGTSSQPPIFHQAVGGGGASEARLHLSLNFLPRSSGRGA